MSQRQTLTKQQIEMLRKSPHVRSVTAHMLSFTAEFKAHIYDERQRGGAFKDILRAAGIDPDLLGAKRIRNLSSSINSQSRRGTGFTDIGTKATLPNGAKKARTPEEKIARLEHELAYIKQEVEYLKKVYLAERKV